MNRHERRGQAKQQALLARRRGGEAAHRTGSLLAAAMSHHEAGRLADAEALYRQVLALDAEHPEALHRLGVLAHQNGQHDAAAQLIRRAIATDGDTAAFHVNLGWVLHSAGHPREAETVLRRALMLDPSDRDARSHLAVVLQAQGRLPEAEAHLRAALSIDPDFADAHSNLGRVLHAERRLEESVESYQQAIALAPLVADYHSNLGVALKALGRLDEAIAAYEGAIALDPRHVAALVNLGIAYRAAGRLIDALGSHARACTLAPDAAPAYANLALVLLELGHLDDSVAVGRQAAALSPDDAGVLTNLGLALQRQGRLEDAVAAYRRALGVAPGLAEARNNVGTALEMLGHLDAATDSYEQAIADGLDHADAHANLGRALAAQGRLDEAVAAYGRADGLAPDLVWRVAAATGLPVVPASTEAIIASRHRLGEALDGLLATPGRVANPDKPVVGPNFYLAYHGLDDRDLQRTMAEMCLHTNPGLRWTAPHCLAPAPAGGRRTRVGFVSAYLREHSIGRLTRGLVGAISRDRFEVVVFHTRGAVDEMSAAIDRCADRAIRLPGSLDTARHLIAAEQMDVLVYPEIGMDPFTYHLAFARLAPVQCVMWGHPDTTGIPTVDYFLSSADLDPDGNEAHYTERLQRLSRLPAYYERPRIAAPPPTRAALGVDEDATLYLCPQSLFKLHPDYDQILGDILRRDGKGTLVLIEGMSAHWSRRWRERFARTCGDVSDRVRILPRRSHADFLGLLTVADALLDPLPFGGGTTAYAALGLGLPVVTWPRSLMRGRATYACYRQLGVMDCVADSAARYVALAVRLANDPAWRREIGERILAGAPHLFEDAAAVREIEEFLERARAAV